jgi:large subunit ribosomal protein L15e
MSAYKYMRKLWKKPRANLKESVRGKLIVWRKQHTIERVDKPTKLARARSLGYKAKQGFAVARVKMRKGGRRRQADRRGRKPSKAGLVHFTHGKSLQWIAEEKAQRRFPNMEVLNSYMANEDGQYEFYEVILVDPSHPVVRSDKNIKWITTPTNRHRVLKGLTSAGKKVRGLR